MSTCDNVLKTVRGGGASQVLPLQTAGGGGGLDVKLDVEFQRFPPFKRGRDVKSFTLFLEGRCKKS